MKSKLLSEAMKDERIAPKQYLRLKKQLKRKKDKRIVSGIIKDERRHLRALKRIKK